MSGPGSKPAGFWRLVKTVFGKEMIDAVRDRRSLMSALAFPLFGPLLIAVMFNTIARSERKVEIIELPVAGAELAPSLVGFLAGHGVADRGASGRSRGGGAPRRRQHGAGDFRSEYPEAFRRADPAEVRLILDGSRRSAASSVQAHHRSPATLQLPGGESAPAGAWRQPRNQPAARSGNGSTWASRKKSAPPGSPSASSRCF